MTLKGYTTMTKTSNQIDTNNEQKPSSNTRHNKIRNNNKQHKGFGKGLSALRAVRKASKDLSDAKTQLDTISQNLNNNENIYNYRHQVEMQYTQIKAEGVAVVEQTSRGMQQTQAVINQVEAQTAKLNEILTNLKLQNEQALRPYKQLLDSAQGHLSEIGRASCRERV